MAAPCRTYALPLSEMHKSILADPAIQERFWAKVARGCEEECWDWKAAVTKGGYGTVWIGGSVMRAPRISYYLAYGTIDENKAIDHLCRNRRCVNPAHLELVSHRENVLRGNSPLALKARQTHCKRGHRLIGSNIYRPPTGAGNSRRCLACLMMTTTLYRQNKKLVNLREKGRADE